ncbi:MAG: methyltransferase domain-containing protein [Thiohalobacterales bacterium]|nr:methyltransferase domain-containing protein [Thiohalobacterales bacterium]
METNSDLLNAYTVVFDQLEYLGPGDAVITEDLAERLRPDLPARARIADFGCGTGASALVLARCLPEARVLALDSHAPFIARLEAAASARGLGERISAVAGDMEDPPPLDGVQGGFDLIWSESAIYSIGRTTAFACWRPLMNPDGWLVFSDIVWQREPAARSDTTSAFWAVEYPDITTAAAIMDELTAAGFKPLQPVLAGRKAWSSYYEPLRQRLQQLKTRGGHPEALANLIAELEREIDVYDRAGEEVAPCFFLARRNSIPA